MDPNSAIFFPFFAIWKTLVFEELSCFVTDEQKNSSSLSNKQGSKQVLIELELESEWFIFHRKYGHLHLRKIICHLG